MPSQIVPPSPTDLGFSEKFNSWRQYQPESIEASLTNEKRADIHCAPTGFGKSGCYQTTALLTEGRSAIVTRTLGLCDQIMEEGRGLGFVTIMGKDNYTCSAQPGWTCKDGAAGGCSRRGSMECPHTYADNVAKTAKVLVTNYKCWINGNKYGKGWGTFERLILDEGHEAPEEVADAMQVKLSFNEIQDMLKQDFPKGMDPTGDTWKVWATLMRSAATQATLKMGAKIQGNRNVKPTWIKDYHHLKNLVQKLAVICLMRPADWIWELYDWGWQFDPIKFGRYAESRLFLKIPKLSIYSATIREQSCHQMGLWKDDYNFHDWPSVFDPARAPVYWVPTQKVQYGMGVSQLVNRIDQFYDKRLDLNGLIHTSSYQYRNDIVAASRNRQYMVSNWDGEPPAKAMERFRDFGGALIGPAYMTGYDLTDDLCRWQIFTKIPFEPKSKINTIRQQHDKLYGPHKAANKLQQAWGRGVRSKTDWCEGVLLDDNAEWFIRAYRFLFSKAAMERYSLRDSLPPRLRV